MDDGFVSQLCRSGIISFDDSSEPCNIENSEKPVIIAFWDDVPFDANVCYFNSTGNDNEVNKFAKRYFKIRTYLQKGFGGSINPMLILVATWVTESSIEASQW